MGLAKSFNLRHWNAQLRRTTADAQKFAPGEEDSMQKGNSPFTPVTLFNLTRLHGDEQTLALSLSLPKRFNSIERATPIETTFFFQIYCNPGSAVDSGIAFMIPSSSAALARV